MVVSMVTADSDVPLNNEHGPDSLRNIGPSLDVAEAVGCDLIRVCLKQLSDVEPVKRAADLSRRPTALETVPQNRPIVLVDESLEDKRNSDARLDADRAGRKG
jgi:hypothetical protein